MTAILIAVGASIAYTAAALLIAGLVGFGDRIENALDVFPDDDDVYDFDNDDDFRAWTREVRR